MKAADLSHVYTIQAGEDGPIKIGVGKNPHSRVKELQTGNPYKLRLIGYSAVRAAWAVQWERKIHERLKTHRLEGEWFRLSPYVKQVVEAIAHGDLVKALEIRAPAEMARFKSAVPIRATAAHAAGSLYEFWELANPGLRVNHDKRVPLPAWVTGATV